MEEAAAAIFSVLNIFFHYKSVLQISKLTDTDVPFLIDKNPI